MVKYDYDAWGTTSIKQDTSSSSIGYLNPFRYKGYYYDSESGMYYCKTRYYVPLWGRWLNADSPKNLILTNASILNNYGYCSNSPINYRDKMEHYHGEIFGMELRISLQKQSEAS